MEDIDKAYTERAHLIAFVAKCFPSVLGSVDDAELMLKGYHWIIYIYTPEGQLSWHIADRDIHLFDFCNRRDDVPWDGHTSEEKYRRLSKLKIDSVFSRYYGG